MPIIPIVAAAGAKQVIGKDGDLPWHFSSDLKFFKEKTMGHPVLMGRVTHESIVKRLGKPLPNRRSIVLTRDKDYRDDRVEVIDDPSQLNILVKADEMLYVIGGATIYQLMLPLADKVYLTHIDMDIEGDTFFPPLNPLHWLLQDEFSVIEKGVTLRFCQYTRLQP